MKIVRLACLLLLAVFKVDYLPAQDTILFSLQEAIDLAKINSLDAQIARNSLRVRCLDYDNYKAALLPKLSLSGTLPNYFRSVNSITLQTGEYDFVYQEVASSNANLDLWQNIGLTGGKVSISSNLARLDNFRTSNTRTTYSSAPYIFSYIQNSFFYNEFKWRKRIEPLKQEEAKREYLERLEEIAFRTVENFFSVLISDFQVRLNGENAQSLDTLVKIMQGRMRTGNVDLNAILQAKLKLSNAKRSLASAARVHAIALQNLYTQLRIDPLRGIQLQIPDNIVEVAIDIQKAMIYAQNNRKATISFQRRRLEAEEQVSKTKAETGPSISFRTDLGLSQTGIGVADTYSSRSLPRQSFVVAFNIPLVDWGVNKSNRARAEANRELLQSNMESEEIASEYELKLDILEFKEALNQLSIIEETKALAQECYKIAKQRYALGNISLADFNDALIEKDRAILEGLDSLKSYWLSLYAIRRSTLYDFLKDRPIDYDERVLR